MSMEKKRERKRMIVEGREFFSFPEERRIEKKKKITLESLKTRHLVDGVFFCLLYLSVGPSVCLSECLLSWLTFAKLCSVQIFTFMQSAST